MNELKSVHRMRPIEEALGYDEFIKCFQIFTQTNNFSHYERMAILHMMNSIYFMGKVWEKSK